MCFDKKMPVGLGRSSRAPKRKLYGIGSTKEDVKKAKTDTLSVRDKHSTSDNSSLDSSGNVLNSPKTPSEAKLGRSDLDETMENAVSGFRLIDLELLVTFLNHFHCNGCDTTGKQCSEKLLGLKSELLFTCENCNYTEKFETSKKNSKGPYEVNLRFAMGTFDTGGNRRQAERMCLALNMPPPPQPTAWTALSKRVHRATGVAADESKTIAGKEYHSKFLDIHDADVVDATVSCDSTWQRCGLSSKNGVATVISVNSNMSKGVGHRGSVKLL